MCARDAPDELSELTSMHQLTAEVYDNALNALYCRVYSRRPSGRGPGGCSNTVKVSRTID
jgi:hypothetical protein